MTTKIHTIIRILLVLAGILLLLNIAFMYLVANPTIGFLAQIAISLVLVLYGVLFSGISKRIHAIFISVFAVPFLFSLFLAIYGNRSNVDYTEDVVIVLGAGVMGENVSRPLAHRLIAATDYWFENQGSKIVVTGGLGNLATITEAEAMARFLIRRGVPEEVIILEDQSTTTYENLLFAKEILDEYFPEGYRVVLISNDFHMYRGVQMARQVGLDVNYKGAYTDWYSWPVNYLREMLAVLHFWVFPLA